MKINWNYRIERLRRRLILLLANDDLVLLNSNINPNAIKDGYSVVSFNPDDEKAAIRPFPDRNRI